jgi:hypothetical protein
VQFLKTLNNLADIRLVAPQSWTWSATTTYLQD